MNKLIEPLTKVTVVAENIARRAKYDFFTDLSTLLKETTREQYLIAMLMELEANFEELIPQQYLKFHNKISTLLGTIFLDHRVVVLSSRQEWVLCVLRFGRPGRTDLIAESKYFWLLGYRDNIVNQI